MDFESTPISDGEKKPQSVSPFREVAPPVINRYQSGENDKLPKFSLDKIIRWLIVLSVLLLSFAVIFFLQRTPFNPLGLEINLDGPEEASAGEELTYRLTYKNNTEAVIKNLNINLFYPQDAIVLVEGQTQTPRKKELIIENLVPGQEQEEEFPFFLVGDRGDIKTIRAVFSFRPQGVSSDFEREIEVPISITKVPVQLSLVSPPSAVSGETITYILDYQNISGDDIVDARFKVTYPDGFNPTSFSPQPDEGNSVWKITSLAEGRKDRIQISGQLHGEEREAKIVSVELQREFQNAFITYTKAETTTIIGNPALSVRTGVSGFVGNNAQPGDVLDYSINYANDSGETLFGVSISAKLEGLMYDLAGLTTDGFLSSSDQTIVWNASSVPKLGTLRSGEGGTVTFRIPLKRQFPTGGLGSSAFSVKATITAQANESSGGANPAQISTTDSVVTKLKSQPTFVQQGYVSQTLGGQGPIPPRVGEKTTYVINWEITNPGADVTQARVSAILPPGVEWESETKIQGTTTALSFNKNNRQVSWDLNNIPARTGTTFPKLAGYFKISITPAQNQIGQSPDLIGGAQLGGADSFTGETISLNVGGINTSTLVDGVTGQVQP